MTRAPGTQTRADRVREAIRAIHARGTQPSPGRIQMELMEYVTHNLNGRDSKVYAEEMTALGYVRRERTPGSWNMRWTRP